MTKPRGITMSYLFLGVRYFKNGRNRTVWTIIGVTMVASFLLLGMWITFSWIDLNLQFQRERLGFDLVVNSTDRDLAADLIADPKISKVTVGSLEDLSNHVASDQPVLDPSKWNNTPVLFVSLKNPKKIQKYCDLIRGTYGVETARNQRVTDALENRDFAYAVALLLCYLVSISGVAMVRNSLQFSAMEQIKDYGNLRCIGATKNQLRMIQYVQGILLVTISLLAASLLSLTLSGILNGLLKAFFNTISEEAYRPTLAIKIRVLPIPILYVVSAFYFDLYFILRENLKSVYGMSPAEAISGHFRILNKKIRSRKARLIRMLFGIEGEYAYKNLLRYPGRLWRNTALLAISVTTITVAFCYLGEHLAVLTRMQDQFVYYQICVPPEYEYFNTLRRNFSEGWLASYYDDMTMYDSVPTESLESLAKSGFATDSNVLYQEYLVTVEKVSDHVHLIGGPEDFHSSVQGAFRNCHYEENDGIKAEHSWGFRAFTEEEKDFYRPALTQGTLELSENGIILINGAKNIDLWSYTPTPSEYLDLTTFQVGDTIRVLDPASVEKKNSEWVEQVYRNDEAMLKLYREENPEDARTDAELLQSTDFHGFRNTACEDEYQTLYEEALNQGLYTTYTIEGILSVDPLYSTGDQSPIFLLPKDRYFELTGEDENTARGTFCYHIEHPVLFAFYRLYTSGQSFADGIYGRSSLDTYIYSPYTQILGNWGDRLVSMSTITLLLLLAITGFLFISFINIRNATNSSLFLRKKEFAQLYVIGCTNRSIGRMIRYEGFLSGLLAMGLGAIASFPGIFLLSFEDPLELIEPTYSINWLIYLIALILAAIPVIGFYGLSVGHQSRKMKVNAAEDLITAGE